MSHHLECGGCTKTVVFISEDFDAVARASFNELSFEEEVEVVVRMVDLAEFLVEAMILRDLGWSEFSRWDCSDVWYMGRRVVRKLDPVECNEIDWFHGENHVA
jgi:hypothetical protein